MDLVFRPWSLNEKTKKPKKIADLFSGDWCCGRLRGSGW
jgi:hypothetical protein